MKPCPISAEDICFRLDAGVDMLDAASLSCKQKINTTARKRNTHFNHVSICTSVMVQKYSDNIMLADPVHQAFSLTSHSMAALVS